MSFKEFVDKKKRETLKEATEEIEIYFNDLSEELQGRIMNSIREELNVTDKDDVSTDKINTALADNPIVVLTGNQIVTKVGL